MSTCTKCATFWTSPGMKACPICGTSVEEPVAEMEPSRDRIKSEPVAERRAGSTVHKGTNGTVVLEGPKDAPRPKTRPLPTPDPEPGPPPIPMPPIIKDDPIKVTMFPKAEKPAEVESDDPMGDPLGVGAEGMAPVKPKPLSVDASVVLMKPAGEEQSLPTPARPLNAPLILGVLAAVTAVMLPITMAFENHRIIGIIGFCLSGFFLPFAPIAWVAGLSAEK